LERKEWLLALENGELPEDTADSTLADAAQPVLV